MKSIVILQRGWVVIGMLDKSNPNEFVLTDASVIRYWGTTKGIGEIALNGPTNKTILDPCGTVRFNPLTIVCMMDAK